VDPELSSYDSNTYLSIINIFAVCIAKILVRIVFIGTFVKVFRKGFFGRISLHRPPKVATSIRFSQFVFLQTILERRRGCVSFVSFILNGRLSIMNIFAVCIAKILITSWIYKVLLRCLGRDSL